MKPEATLSMPDRDPALDHAKVCVLKTTAPTQRRVAMIRKRGNIPKDLLKFQFVK